jgi:uncharacterized protein YcbX
LDTIDCALDSLHVYPVKSCAGVRLEQALVAETGLDLDRQWMVVDEQREMLTQRDLPRMALVQCRLRGDEVILRAPGMLALHLSVVAVEEPMRVRVWGEAVAAFSMGPLAAQWFSDFLGRKVRLVRFDPEQRRLSSQRWTGAIEAENAFSDGYPLLVAGSSSLDDLNRRLRARGSSEVSMARFRPNLVVAGLEPYDEDHVDTLSFDTPGGPVVLRLVKPCSRCPIPNIDPSTAERGHEPGDILASFRANARLDGAVCFGMNAVIVEGFGLQLQAGQAGRARLAFQ